MAHPIFGPCPLWSNDWIDQDATWYRGKPRPRRLCVRWRPSSAAKRGKAPSFRPMSVVANGWMDEDATWYGSRPRPRPHFIWRGPSSRERGTAAPLFSAHVYCGHGRPSPISATTELSFLVLWGACAKLHVHTEGLIGQWEVRIHMVLCVASLSYSTFFRNQSHLADSYLIAVTYLSDFSAILTVITPNIVTLLNRLSWVSCYQKWHRKRSKHCLYCFLSVKIGIGHFLVHSIDNRYDDSKCCAIFVLSVVIDNY